MADRAQISVTGVVQGVGFRPYVHALASQLGVRGFVSNTASGVVIEAEGERLFEFLDRLPREAPPLARIAGLSITTLPAKGFTSFTIRTSADLPGAFTLVAPDVSLCADCRGELNDPADRRYRYPFINCTNCGPRYSITRAVPYDRPNTTMAAFRMCPDCDREYSDPYDRRFHAQPNACPVCGPTCGFKVQNARFKIDAKEPISSAIEVLRQGGVVAVKGLGGFHLVCDAANDMAVRTLRERKRRSNKPFAVMARDVPAIRAFCAVSDAEELLLLSVQRPIVLLDKRTTPVQALSEAVSPDFGTIGCMLPYTPLHELLFQGEGQLFRALVMTSGNNSEEPIVRDNDEAAAKLGPLVDAFLFHDRDIFMRVDDSVIRVSRSGFGVRSEAAEQNSCNFALRIPHSQLLFIRRSRGFAPGPIALHADGPEVLGCGGDLKNTFTLTKGAWAVPSQHIGDMENYETLRFFEETLGNLQQVYRVEPVAIARDLHPGYLSTRWANERGSSAGSGSPIAIFGIQHHYAHIGSVMAEAGITDKVIGISFDGTGYGTDGNLWGGEFLIADIDGFERAGQLAYLPLPGGEAAIREPWRTAVSLVRSATEEEAIARLQRVGLVERCGEEAVRQVLQVAASSELSPLASGAGRYFDAVAALLGLCDRNTFEGEAAMALEALVRAGSNEHYPVDYVEQNGYTTVDLAPMVRSVLDDLDTGRDRGIIATWFHATMTDIIVTMAVRLRERSGIRNVALSGGTFQNRYMLDTASDRLREAGMVVHVNTCMPPNDACISLGQAYIVRERLKRRQRKASGERRA